MGNSLPTEKLHRNNFASWEYKMHQYLVGQGYWSTNFASKEHKKIDPNQQLLNTQLGASRKPSDVFLWGHVSIKKLDIERCSYNPHKDTKMCRVSEKFCISKPSCISCRTMGKFCFLLFQPWIIL